MWKYTVIELYCGLYWEYDRKSGKYYYELKPGNEDFDDMKRVENPEYDPEFPKQTPPVSCTKMAGIDCVKNKCIHVAYSDGSN